MHGIQTIPLVALLLGGVATVRTKPPATTWVHAAGIGWLAACTTAAIHALAGDPPMEASLRTAVIVAGLAARGLPAPATPS